MHARLCRLALVAVGRVSTTLSTAFSAAVGGLSDAAPQDHRDAWSLAVGARRGFARSGAVGRRAAAAMVGPIAERGCLSMRGGSLSVFNPFEQNRRGANPDEDHAVRRSLESVNRSEGRGRLQRRSAWSVTVPEQRCSLMRISCSPPAGVSRRQADRERARGAPSSGATRPGALAADGSAVRRGVGARAARGRSGATLRR